MNQKQKAILTLTFSIFIIQIVEAFTRREDFPFTQWGMYRTLDDFQKFYDFRFKLQDDTDTSDKMHDPFFVRREVFRYAQLSPFNRHSSTSFSVLAETARENLNKQRTNVEEMIREQLRNSNNRTRVRIIFRGWDQVTVQNVRQPDYEVEVFSL